MAATLRACVQDAEADSSVSDNDSQRTDRARSSPRSTAVLTSSQLQRDSCRCDRLTSAAVNSCHDDKHASITNDRPCFVLRRTQPLADGSLRHNGRRRQAMIGCTNQQFKLKQPISAVIVTFLFATLSPVCDAVSHSGGNRCLQNSCVQRLADYERLIAGGQLTFDVDVACRLFADMVVCIRRAHIACASNSPSDDIKDRWRGLNASLTYICQTVRHEFPQHSKCYSQLSVTSSIKKCNKTYHMKMEAPRAPSDDVCRLTRNLIQCIYDDTNKLCQSEAAAKYVTTAVRLLRQPRLDYHSCTLDCPIVRGSLLLISVAALLATYLSSRTRYAVHQSLSAAVRHLN